MTGGKQYRVQVGDSLRVEKLAAEAGEPITLDKVLMVGAGENVAVGTPYLEGGEVSAKINSHGRGKKIRITKFKRRKNYRRTQGHRQAFTELEITAINAAGFSEILPADLSSGEESEPAFDAAGDLDTGSEET
uniref:Large ribosomal subunit protein bL21 n=1 Tax=Candidatus Kentrum sp. FM TaxID=2126340 RepID=A0A450VQ43_9GAMM|nr:MAG: large subunit ribosomal protein L21 [Candidatus Kentron sp. FM]VFJ70341.1 MAG: large subunit ribosomal protein L21 [Candidatus Kentron sp. FM]VFK06894.1 MAG: large subunit ribosomal protein L21 [Candidatus Kentron sp. FM]